MADIQALIRKKTQEMKAKQSSNVKTVKPAQGKNTYRILPPWREPNEQEKEEGIGAPFWHDFGLHWIKKMENGKSKLAAVYVCSEKTFGTPCELCSMIGEAIASTHDEDQKDLIKESNSKQTYLLNALDRNGENPDEPVVLEVGVKTFEGICEMIGEYGDITDLEDGTDLIINRDGTGFNTKYTVMPARKSAPVDKAVLNKLHDLDAVVSQENSTKQLTALKALSSVTGVKPSGQLLPAAGSPATKTKSVYSDAVVDDDEFENDEAELIEAMEGSSEQDDELDDELEALINES